MKNTKFYVPALNCTYVRKDKVVCYCSLHHCCVSKNQSKKRHCSTCTYKRMQYKGEEIEDWSNLEYEDNFWKSRRYGGMSEDDYFKMIDTANTNDFQKWA